MPCTLQIQSPRVRLLNYPMVGLKKATQKKLETTASRTRLNIIGVMKLDDIQNTVAAQYETINAESIVNHLNLLRNQHGSNGTIHLILDQAPYHRAAKVVQEA